MERNDLIARLSGHFLTEQLPKDWVLWEGEQVDAFLEQHACEAYERMSAADIFENIEVLANDVQKIINGEPE